MNMHTLDANAPNKIAREADAVGVCKAARHAVRALFAPGGQACPDARRSPVCELFTVPSTVRVLSFRQFGVKLFGNKFPNMTGRNNMAKDKSIQGDVADTVDVERRRALSRLGLVATAAYVTPALMTLSQSARASGGSGGSGGGSGGGHGGNRSGSGTSGLSGLSGSSGPSGPSGSSGPSKSSGPSTPSGPSVGSNGDDSMLTDDQR